jgi:hypothetical protein
MTHQYDVLKQGGIRSKLAELVQTLVYPSVCLLLSSLVFTLYLGP